MKIIPKTIAYIIMIGITLAAFVICQRNSKLGDEKVVQRLTAGAVAE